MGIPCRRVRANRGPGVPTAGSEGHHAVAASGTSEADDSEDASKDLGDRGADPDAWVTLLFSVRDRLGRAHAPLVCANFLDLYDLSV